MKVLLEAASAAVAAILIALGGAIPAHADLDFSDYYADLRKHGILVDGNEKYLAELAMIVCQMENAGSDLSDVGDYRLFDFDRAISMRSGLRPAVCGCSGIVSGGPSCLGCGTRSRRV